MGGSAPSPPAPTAEEVALQKQQLTLLKQQQTLLESEKRQQTLLLPLMLRRSGVEGIYDPETNELTGYRELQESQDLSPYETSMFEIQQGQMELQKEMLAQSKKEFEKQDSPLAKQREEIEGAFYQRTLDALQGKLPVNPGLTRGLEEEGALMREQMRRQLGPGWATSTPGIQATAEFSQRKQELLEAARRGDLTLAEQLGLQRGSMDSRRLSDMFARAAQTQTLAELGPSRQLLGYNALMRASQPGITLGAAFGGASGNIGQALQPYIAQRQMQFQGAMAGYQRTSGILGGLASGLGSAFGAWGMGTMFPAAPPKPPSDERLKENIETIRWAGDIRLVTFRWITSKIQDVGVIAQEVQQTHPDWVSIGPDGYLTVDYSMVWCYIAAQDPSPVAAGR